MNDAELAILIRIQSEIASGKDPREILQGIREEAKKVGEEGKKSGHEGGEGMEFLGLKGHEAHAALRLIGGQLGEIGHLLHFIFSPQLAGLVAFTIAIKMIKEQMDELHESTVKQLEASEDLARALKDSHVKAVEASETAQANWDRTLKHSTDNLDLLTKAMERNISIGKQNLGDTKSLTDAQISLAKAYNDAAEASGLITKDQGDINLEQLKEATNRKKEAAEYAEKEAEAEAHKQRAIEASEAADAARRSVGVGSTLLGDRTRIEEERNLATGRVDSGRESAAAARKGLSEAQVHFDEMQKAHDADVRNGNVTGGISLGRLETAGEELKKAKAAASTAEAYLVAQQNLVDKYVDQLKDVEADIEAVHHKITSSEELARAQSELATEIREDLARTKTANAAKDAINTEAARWGEVTKYGHQGDAFYKGADIADRTQATIDKAKQAISTIGERGHIITAEEHSQVLDMLETVIAFQLNSHEGLNAKARLAKIESQLRTLQQQQNGVPNF